MHMAPGEGAWPGEEGRYPFPGLFLSCLKSVALHPTDTRVALSSQTASQSNPSLLLATTMANTLAWGYLLCAKHDTLLLKFLFVHLFSAVLSALPLRLFPNCGA